VVKRTMPWRANRLDFWLRIISLLQRSYPARILECGGLTPLFSFLSFFLSFFLFR
jgi:hypothetical protein